MQAQKEISRFLVTFEFPTRISGYHYLKEGLIFLIEQRSPYQDVPSSKIIYSYLAEKFNTDTENIERCLRTIVCKMWASLSVVGLFQQRPSVREFVLKCAEYIKLGVSQPSVYDILSYW